MAAWRFASFPIRGQVFYQSPLSLGLVNLKPLVPGHVLMIPKRVVPRYSDLTSAEVTDLFLSTQQVSRVLAKEYKAQALNMAIQDGPAAGQSVPHVHVHLIPRTLGDYEPMDGVYDDLDAVDLTADHLLHASETVARRKETRAERKAREAKVFGVDNDERRPRSGEEMEEEARRLASLFSEEVRGTFE